MISGHYSAKYDVELRQLSDRTLEMGQLIEKQLRRAIQSLIHGDRLLEREVLETETVINNLEVEIDRECVEILARRQPIASDLRFIIMIIKTVNDMERMGDEVHRVFEMGSRVVSNGGDSPQDDDIEELAARVHKLLIQTLRVFEQEDDAGALTLIRKDKKVDKKFETTLKKIKKWMMAESNSVPDAIETLWAIRSLERIGDRLCNICEHVIFYVKGEDIRHLDIDEILKQE
ncbi:MAG: phosphate signaling complex protein PhoU [Acidiferrobacterales bacterium]|nr:phosphate signaling complex protein PhoU [Acidiferrobacterales bacterium]